MNAKNVSSVLSLVLWIGAMIALPQVAIPAYILIAGLTWVNNRIAISGAAKRVDTIMCTLNK